MPELHQAAQSRGIKTTAVSPGRLRDELTTWLELRLKYGIPSTLLILSNALSYNQEVGAEAPYDALVATLSSLPDELFHEAELEVFNAEGAATNKQRLEVLKEQQELIEEENQEDQESASSGVEQIKDDDDIDEHEEGDIHPDTIANQEVTTQGSKENTESK